MMDVKVPKDKYISRWFDQRTSSMLDEINQKPSIMTKKVIDRGKRSKTLSEVKQVENISKDLQSFLEISHIQKEALTSHKLHDHAYEY